MVYKQNDEKTDEEQKVIQGFKWVPVFDIASTDGEDLPTVCHQLSGDDPAGIFARLVEFAASIGFTVEDAELPGSVNGDCTHELHRIRVEIANSPARLSDSTPATTPSGTSRAGPEVARRPSPGSKDRASASRRLQHPCCNPSRSNRRRRHKPLALSVNATWGKPPLARLRAL